MRKITLMLTLLCFSFLTFAQMQVAEKGKANADSYVNSYKSVNSVKAAGDVYWAEDFDATRWASSVDENNLSVTDGMPDGWIFYDRNNMKFNWHWSEQGPRGKYCSGNDDVLEPDSTMIINSNTPENGFMMLESAYFNTDASGNIVAESIDMDCFIQSPAIDLTGTPGVILKFEEYFRYCCSSSDSKLDVLVSVDYDPTDSDIDNGHWSTFDVKKGMNANEGFDGSVELDISSVAADQATVYIRWQQTAASHYHWQFDDVQLVEPMSNNILIEKSWADYLYVPNDTVTDYDATLDFNGGYVDIPIAVVGDFVQFRAAVKNFGLATQTGIQLNTVITKDGETEVYNKLSNIVDLEKSERDSLLITDVFTPTQKGHYQVSYTVTQDQDDEYMADNYDGSYFNITDSVFSRTSDDPDNYTGVSPQDYVDAADGDYLLNYYQIPEGSGNVTVSSVTIYFQSYNDSAAIEAGDMSTIFRLYGVEDGDISETPIVSSDLYTIKLEDRGTFITLPFIKDGAETIEPGEYWVAVEAYTNYSEDNKIRFEIGNDKTVPVTKDGTYCHTGGSTYLTYDNAVIDLNIVPTTPDVGIENLNDLNDLNEISIYPNPVSSELHINNINNVNRIVISNVLGQEVRTISNPVNELNINVSDFNKGMYIVTIIDNNNNSKSTRFIKQ